MKKRFVFIFVCIIALFSVLLLPCSAAISEIDDALVVDSYLYATDASYSDVVWFDHRELTQGETSEEISRSFAQVPNKPALPYCFKQDLQVKGSTGLPICGADTTYELSLSNMYLFLDSETDYPGMYYLKNIRDIRYQFKYTDGSWSPFKTADYETYFNNNHYGFSLTFPTGTKNVQCVYISLYYYLNDFGYPGNFDQFTSADWYDLMLVAGVNNFNIQREEVFPSPSGVAFDHYHVVEDELLEDITPGVTSVKNVFNDLTGLLSSGPIYKGTLFVSNLLTEFVGEVPIFNNLLYVSLSLGAAMVIVGSVLFSVGSFRKRGDFGKDRNNKNKGG